MLTRLFTFHYFWGLKFLFGALFPLFIFISVITQCIVTIFNRKYSYFDIWSDGSCQIKLKVRKLKESVDRYRFSTIIFILIRTMLFENNKTMLLDSKFKEESKFSVRS